MAKTSGFLSEASGKLGNNLVARQTVHGTVLAKMPRKTSTPRRSEKQMYLRCQLSNEAANFKLYEGKLALAFEEKGAGQTEYNLFVQANYGVNPVFITKQERLNGACVVADYQFCRGSLKSIAVTKNGAGVMVSDIALGDLVIGETTTVAEFSAAVLGHNPEWEELDQMTFFYAKQTTDPVSGVPRADMDSWKVVLDLLDNSRLMEHVSAVGFANVDGYLGMSEALVDGGIAWVHSRENSSTIKVGSQRLVVVSGVLSYYQSERAMRKSYDSYGGVNSKVAYLKPVYSTGAFGPSGPSGSASGSEGSNSPDETGGPLDEPTEPGEASGEGGKN